MKVLRLFLSLVAVLGLLGAGLILVGCGEPDDFPAPPVHEDPPADPWQPEEPVQPDPGI